MQSNCSICDRPALFRCGKCKSERYCSRECQRDHWPHHKAQCARLAAAAAATAAAPAGTAVADPAHPPGAHSSDQAPVPPGVNSRAGLHAAAPSGDSTAGGLQPTPPAAPPGAGPPGAPTPRAARLRVGGPTHAPSAPQPQPPQQRHGQMEGAVGPGTSHGTTAAASTPASGTAGAGGPPEPQPPPAPPPAPLPTLSAPGGTAPLAPRPPPGPPPAAPPARPPPGAARPAPFVRAPSILDRLTAANDGTAAVPQPPTVLSATPSNGAFITALPDMDSGQPCAVSPAATPPATSLSGSPHPVLLPSTWSRSGPIRGDSCLTHSVQLSELPPELVLLVFRLLPARALAVAGCVCRAWRRAAREPWLWVRQVCAAGYSLPASALMVTQTAAKTHATAALSAVGPGQGGDRDAGQEGEEEVEGEGLRAVAGVRGIRVLRAVRHAGGSSHDDFLGGLRAGFLDRLQRQQQQQQQQGHQGQQGHRLGGLGFGLAGAPRGQPHDRQQREQQQGPGERVYGGCDLKALYGRTVRLESNWRTARYAELALREHTSNVECLAFQRAEPWGAVLLSAAWDGGVCLFALGGEEAAAAAGPRCVRRYRGHAGWITGMAAGRYRVVTASTDRRVAAWRYAEDTGTAPWSVLEHPAEVTAVRFCYAPPPPSTTHYLSTHLVAQEQQPREPLVYDSATDAYGTAPDSYAPALEDYVITASVDGMVRMWRLHDRALLRMYCGHGDVVWGLACLYGSSVMVTSSRDGTTRLWQLPNLAEVEALPHAAVQAETVDALATLCGHTSPILCMDTLRVAAGVVPPPPPLKLELTHGTGAALAASASGAGVVGGNGGGSGALGHLHARAAAAAQARQEARVAAAAGGMTAALAVLLNTHLVDGVTTPAARARAEAALAAVEQQQQQQQQQQRQQPLPCWLVATGGADALVRVWDLGGATCLATLRGHTLGVLSVKLGYLPRCGAGRMCVGSSSSSSSSGGAFGLEDHPLLPPDFPVPAVASNDGPLLPPGLYGEGYAPLSAGRRGCRASSLVQQQGQEQQGRGALAHKASQRLVVVSGSVREVRVWDPVAGTCLQQLEDHNGPVTTLALIHGVLVTLAMNDGLVVYKCNGVPDAQGPGGGRLKEHSSSSSSNAGGGSSDAGTAGGGGAGSRATHGDAGAAGGQQQHGAAVTSTGAGKAMLEPVVCMQDAHHRSFAAALAVSLEGLAVGSGTGEVLYLDMRPKGSALPSPFKGGGGRGGGGRRRGT